MDATVYYNNLNAISKHNHELFLKLSKITENTNFDVSISQDDPLKINIYDKDSKMWMFKDPINETHRLISGFEDFQKYPLLFFFGFGNGVFLKAILSNKTHERIYIIEPKLEILFIALHFLDFSEDIESKRIRIFLAEDFTYNTIRSLVGNDGVAAYLKTYTLNSTSAYYSKYTNLMVSVNKIIIDAILHFIKSHGNCASDSLLGIDHFLKNIPLMLKNYPFVDVAQRKNSEVAVIVSTGPSLTKQLPLLKEIQKNVTIICVDASMPILEKWGIKPDIVTSLERIEDTALFFEKTSKEFQDGVVFLSSALQHEKIYQNIKGGYLTIVMRPFGYMEIFGLHGYGYIGIGMSAANMAHELAYIMNYSDVILIGQDLAYGDDGLSHAKDHVYGEDEVKGYKTDTYVTKWGGNGKVKTKSSERKVPIHSQLIEKFNFISYVNMRKNSNHEMLFDLKSIYYKGKIKFSHYFLRDYFTDFRNSFVTKKRIEEDLISFHSLRHSFATRLRSGRVEFYSISNLMGHTVDTILKNIFNLNFLFL